MNEPKPARPRKPAIQRPEPLAPALLGSAPIKPIRTPKIAHIVADRLRRLIVTGQLQPGDTLPPESQLMSQFEISRPALREALRILEAESLIAIGRGIRGGATILLPKIDKVAQHGTLYLIANATTLLEIHEARTLIEPPVAAQLAIRADRLVVETLSTCVRQGLAALESGDIKSAMLASNNFHTRLVQFSGNKALGLLVGILHDISESNYTTLYEEWTDQDTRIQRLTKAFKALERLVELIAQAKPAETEAFWHSYMERTAEVFASSRHVDVAITL
ncbi:MAG: GntR family transcriptional regulator [Rhodocyclaceae bacterium]|nr:GntR family transcriptional regulator [Rhodocyclaceae bacterium]